MTLVHARDQILPEVSPSLREFARVKMEEAGIQLVLNSRVVLATSDGVELKDGRMIRGATVVCTIGTTMPRQAWAGLERRPLSTFIETASDHRLSPHGTFEEAVRLFDQQAVEFLCVLDADERLQGIITRSELFEAFAQGKTPAAQARDFMRTDPLAVTPQDTSLIVGALMNKHDIDWLPIVADKESRRLIGIIRSERMLRYLMSSPSE